LSLICEFDSANHGATKDTKNALRSAHSTSPKTRRTEIDMVARLPPVCRKLFINKYFCRHGSLWPSLLLNDCWQQAAGGVSSGVTVPIADSLSNAKLLRRR